MGCIFISVDRGSILVGQCRSRINEQAHSVYKPRARPMQSFFRLNENCSGGNLLKIHTNKCTNGQCEAKLDGASTKESTASKCCYNATVRVNTGYEIAER